MSDLLIYKFFVNEFHTINYVVIQSYLCFFIKDVIFVIELWHNTIVSMATCSAICIVLRVLRVNTNRHHERQQKDVFMNETNQWILIINNKTWEETLIVNNKRIVYQPDENRSQLLLKNNRKNRLFCFYSFFCFNIFSFDCKQKSLLFSLRLIDYNLFCC